MLLTICKVSDQPAVLAAAYRSALDLARSSSARTIVRAHRHLPVTLASPCHSEHSSIILLAMLSHPSRHSAVLAPTSLVFLGSLLGSPLRLIIFFSCSFHGHACSSPELDGRPLAFRCRASCSPRCQAVARSQCSLCAYDYII